MQFSDWISNFLAQADAFIPWAVFSPRRFAVLILILAFMQLASYWAAKMLGKGKGALALGLVGGLISSTAVTLSTARASQKESADTRSLLITLVAAQVAALVESFTIVLIAARSLLDHLLIPFGATLALALTAIYFLFKDSPLADSDVSLKSPIDWKGVLRLAIVFTFVLAVVAITERALGSGASVAVSVVTGLFELHAVTLALSTMFASGGMPAEAAANNILIASTASFIAKIAICATVGRERLALVAAAIFIALAAALWVGSFISQLA